MIEVAEKSTLWLRFTVKGRQCHASMPHHGVNACRAAAHAIVALDELSRGYDRTDPLFDVPHSTFEPTKHDANVPNINTIPGLDVFCLDSRILPGTDVDEVLERARQIAAEAVRPFGAECEVEVVMRSDATAPTAPDAPVVRALSAAIRVALGVEARPLGIGGGTVAALFRRAGRPAAVWCPWSDMAHQPDEYCLISHMLAGARVFARLFARPF
jgi:succinyl-diaminopimelate desuccinylase